jgi:hypothetical protein
MNGWILELCENSWATYLSSSFAASYTSQSVYCVKGISEVEKVGPLIIASGESAEEVEIGSGIYNVSMLLHLAVPYEGTGSVERRNEIAEQFNRYVYTGSIVEELSAITGSHGQSIGCFALYFNGHNNGFEGDCWISNNLINMVVVHKTTQ